MVPSSGQHHIAVCVSRALEPIFQQFLEIQRRYLDELDTALARGDLPALHRLGHTIKGGAATYQLLEAAALGDSLEVAALDQDIEAVAALVLSLKRYYAAVAVTFVD
jgi:HPt (histidine-containing phosphotransfer) domain-containing protein